MHPHKKEVKPPLAPNPRTVSSIHVWPLPQRPKPKEKDEAKAEADLEAKEALPKICPVPLHQGGHKAHWKPS